MRLVLFVIAASWAQSAAAYNSCFEPRDPYCVGAFGTYEDQFAFDRCLSDIEGYQRDVNEFLGCLDRRADEIAREMDELTQEMDELRVESNDAIETYNGTIETFNCKAEGGIAC